MPEFPSVRGNTTPRLHEFCGTSLHQSRCLLPKNDLPSMKLPLKKWFLKKIQISKTIINICISLTKKHQEVTRYYVVHIYFSWWRASNLAAKITFFSLRTIVRLLRRYFIFSWEPLPMLHHVLNQAFLPQHTNMYTKVFAEPPIFSTPVVSKFVYSLIFWQ